MHLIQKISFSFLIIINLQKFQFLSRPLITGNTKTPFNASKIFHLIMAITHLVVVSRVIHRIEIARFAPELSVQDQNQYYVEKYDGLAPLFK